MQILHTVSMKAYEHLSQV